MKVYSIFSSINGEVCNAHQGSMCTFIRLAGCHVGCNYCDTRYASDPDSGYEMSIHEISVAANVLGNTNITITGGEPLEQMEELKELIDRLRYFGYEISIETSGEIPFDRNDFDMPNMLHFVVDIKLGTLFKLEKYLSMNLNEKDFLKIVIENELDMTNACTIKRILQKMNCPAKFAFSPSYGWLSPKHLLNMMKERKQQDAILNVQLHKLLSLEEDK